RLDGALDDARVLNTYARLIGASIPAAFAGGAVGFGITEAVGSDAPGSLSALVSGGLVLLGVFLVLARRMRIDEVDVLLGRLRNR
ncbi:hypothetical protein, partial [Priestia megaterium]|uniref:hypothetical protein n=1 Tax=Priestia megaterium TaxID=1404 RepID=UPI0036DAD461